MSTWTMFGYPAPDREDTWYALGDERYVRMYGCAEPVPVEVIEDADGTHLGWIDADDERNGDDTPVMIQHHKIFNVQFLYGYQAEEKAEHGRAVRLTIKEAS